MSVRETLVRAPLCSEALHEAQQSASGLVCAELEWLHKELQGVRAKAWRMKDQVLHKMVRLF